MSIGDPTPAPDTADQWVQRVKQLQEASGAAEVSLTLTFDDVSLTYVWPGDAPDEHED